MNWQKRVCKSEMGASLLIVLLVITVSSILFASMLYLVYQSKQTLNLMQVKTQAFYNARTGVSFTVAEMNSLATSSTSAADLVNRVTAQLSTAEQNGAPFSVQLTYQQIPNSNPAEDVFYISSKATLGAVTVPINYQTLPIADSTFSGTGGTGGTSTSPTSIAISNPTFTNSYGGLGISISGSGISTSGSGTAGQVTVSSSGVTTVTGVAYLQTYSKGSTSTSTCSSAQPCTVWASGSSKVSTPVTGTLITSGKNDTISAPIDGSAIITGTNGHFQYPVNGATILTGDGNKFFSNLNCDAIITGSNNQINISGFSTVGINGVLLMTGNSNTINGDIAGYNNSAYTSSAYASVVITGTGNAISGNIYGNVVATGSSLKIKGTIYGNLIEVGTSVTVSNVTGTITQFAGNSVTLTGSCIGSVPVSFSSGSAVFSYGGSSTA